MKIEELKQELQKVENSKKQAESLFYQMIGQESLLQGLIKKAENDAKKEEEERIKKEKEDKEKENKDGDKKEE